LVWLLRNLQRPHDELRGLLVALVTVNLKFDIFVKSSFVFIQGCQQNQVM
jgi:hypothetical protein